MAEHFSFFDAVLQEDGVTYDREYNAQQFTKYFGALVTTGVMKGTGNMLAVSANGSNMVTKIDTGIAFVEAKYYENDSFLELTHDTETLGKDRIDRIVVRMDLSTEARYVKAFIKKGAPSTNPVAPPLTQSPNLYEISLAQVKIVGGQTFIATNAITDERGKGIICPWAGSNILPSFDDNALKTHMDDYRAHSYYIGVLTEDATGGYNVSLPGVTQYEVGLKVTFKVATNNTKGFPTLNINGLGKVEFSYSNAYPIIDANVLKPNLIYEAVMTSNVTFILLGVVPLSDDITTASSLIVATASAVKRVNDKHIIGIGVPEGSVTAPQGTIYTRSDVSTAAASLYVKLSGNGNTGWSAR